MCVYTREQTLQRNTFSPSLKQKSRTDSLVSSICCWFFRLREVYQPAAASSGSWRFLWSSSEGNSWEARAGMRAPSGGNLSKLFRALLMFRLDSWLKRFRARALAECARNFLFFGLRFLLILILCPVTESRSSESLPVDGLCAMPWGVYLYSMGSLKESSRGLPSEGSDFTQPFSVGPLECTLLAASGNTSSVRYHTEWERTELSIWIIFDGGECLRAE